MSAVVTSRVRSLILDWDRLWDMGYHQLVSVVPPKVPISPKSPGMWARHQAGKDPRGKAPGVLYSDGAWGGYRWTNVDTTRADVDRWKQTEASIGIKTGFGGLRLIDADTEDPIHAEIIADKVREIIGDTPLRIGKAPKAGYVVRVEGDYPFTMLPFGERDERKQPKSRVEILGTGRQFVAVGIHPGTGMPYYWERPLVPLDELPVVTPEQLNRLLEELRPLLGAEHVHTQSVGGTVDQAALRGTKEAVEKAIRALPNNGAFDQREDWLRVGYALRGALPDDLDHAFELFNEFSDRWEHGENEDGMSKTEWDRMTGAPRLGASWLYQRAEEHSGGTFVEGEAFFQPVEGAPAPEPEVEVDPFMSIRQVVSRPAPPWLIKRHVPQQSVGIIHADPNVGKSFIMLDQALSIAHRFSTWQGDEIEVPEDAYVLYIAPEGSFGYRNRILAWLQQHGISVEDASEFFLFDERTTNFLDMEAVMALATSIAKRIAGKSMAMIVIDTVSRSIPGADENLQEAMSKFVETLSLVQKGFRCAVAGVHHSAKTGAMRGSTVIAGAADWIFKLTRDEDDDRLIRMHCEKQKDGDRGWEDAYRLDKVFLEEEPDQSSLVPRRLTKTEDTRQEITPAITSRVLHAIDTAWKAGAPLSRVPQSKDRFIVTIMVRDFHIDGAEAEKLVRTWLQMGTIEELTVSAKHKRKGLRVVSMPSSMASSNPTFTPDTLADGEIDGEADGVPDQPKRTPDDKEAEAKMRAFVATAQARHVNVNPFA